MSKNSSPLEITSLRDYSDVLLSVPAHGSVFSLCFETVSALSLAHDAYAVALNMLPAVFSYHVCRLEIDGTAQFRHDFRTFSLTLADVFTLQHPSVETPCAYFG